jgi:hypothetical protein
MLAIRTWVPACAGMTVGGIPARAGMTMVYEPFLLSALCFLLSLLPSSPLTLYQATDAIFRLTKFFSVEGDRMPDNGECCGWASWGELAGMGDGRTSVSGWERLEGDRYSSGGEQDGATAASHWHSGSWARRRLATLRWRLGERNKHG